MPGADEAGLSSGECQMDFLAKTPGLGDSENAIINILYTLGRDRMGRGNRGAFGSSEFNPAKPSASPCFSRMKPPIEELAGQSAGKLR
jgi:hypothetical protein